MYDISLEYTLYTISMRCSEYSQNNLKKNQKDVDPWCIRERSRTDQNTHQIWRSIRWVTNTQQIEAKQSNIIELVKKPAIYSLSGRELYNLCYRNANLCDQVLNDLLNIKQQSRNSGSSNLAALQS